MTLNREQYLTECTLCPRECKADRFHGKKGYCNADDKLVVARAALHMWEEPCISAEEGSGAIFFSNCAMGCVFCQNKTIADGSTGKEISVSRLAEIFLELQEKKANNINLVTPSHYVLQIIEALELAKKSGLHIPVVYNCSGYEKVETLQLLRGYVDIYLPDFKYMDTKLAKKYSKVTDYFYIASKALEEMVAQVGAATFDEQDRMKRGVIVRHLILPGNTTDSKNIIKYLYETYGNQIYLSIMNQFTPLPDVADYPELCHKVTEKEYDEVVDYAISLGVENGFIQEGETAVESFIPAFDLEGV